MPSRGLTNESELASAYSVVATYCEASLGPDSPERGVEHVAVLAREEHVQFGQKVQVFHMAPPIGGGRVRAHAVGVLSGLDPSLLEDIAAWLATVQTQMATPPAIMVGGSLSDRILHAFRDYVVCPAVKWAADQTTGRRRYLGFSCSGFVAECYAEGAGVTLVVAENQLPKVSWEDLEKVWGRLLKLVPTENPEAWLGERGLSGSGPWQVLLPAYLLHAINDEPQLPYKPAMPAWAF